MMMMEGGRGDGRRMLSSRAFHHHFERTHRMPRNTRRHGGKERTSRSVHFIRRTRGNERPSNWVRCGHLLRGAIWRLERNSQSTHRSQERKRLHHLSRCLGVAQSSGRGAVEPRLGAIPSRHRNRRRTCLRRAPPKSVCTPRMETHFCLVQYARLSRALGPVCEW